MTADQLSRFYSRRDRWLSAAKKEPPRALICRFGGPADLKRGPLASETNETDRNRESSPSIAGVARSALPELGRGSISVFVTCGNCDAEYELDDAKIPAGGARLRCTSCDHSFVVTPPEASDIRSANDLAHDALTAERRPEADPDSESESEPIKSFDFSGESEADPEFEAVLEAASEEGFDPNDETEPDPAFEAAMDEGFDIDTEATADAENEVASEEELNLDIEVDLDSEIEAASEEGLDLDVEVDSDSEVEAVSEEGSDLDV